MVALLAAVLEASPTNRHIFLQLRGEPRCLAISAKMQLSMLTAAGKGARCCMGLCS